MRAIPLLPAALVVAAGFVPCGSSPAHAASARAATDAYVVAPPAKPWVRSPGLEPAGCELDRSGVEREGTGGLAQRRHAIGCGLLNGASASAVTIHGETVVPKFLLKNGPSGAISQP